MEIVFRPGATHKNADAMSRRPCARDHGQNPCKQCASRRLDPAAESASDVTSSTQNGEPVISLIQCNYIQTTAAAITTRSTKPASVMQNNVSFQQNIQWSPDVLAAEQLKDPVIGPVIQLMLKTVTAPEQTDLNNLSCETQKLCHQWDSLRLFNQVLYREFIQGDGSVLCYQLIVPDSLKCQLIQYMHASVNAGHWCAQRTLENIRRVAYWGYTAY